MVTDQLIAERLNNVLAKGQALLSQHVTRGDFGLGIEYGPFMAWHSQSLTLLRAYFGPSHTYVQSFETATSFSGGPYAAPAYAESGLGVLHAVAEDISKGWTWQYKELVHADVFTDLLDMADYLLSDGGFKDPAAVLAGSVLEEHIRKLCQKNNIPIQVQSSRGAEPKKASVMNDELVKQQIYNQAEWRSVQAWLDHRNDAAHGHHTKYDPRQIKLMIDGIRDFFVRHPA